MDVLQDSPDTNSDVVSDPKGVTDAVDNDKDVLSLVPIPYKVRKLKALQMVKSFLMLMTVLKQTASMVVLFLMILKRFLLNSPENAC